MTREEEKLKAADEYVKNRIKEGQGRTGDVFPSYLEGAEWADSTMIERACEWLKVNKDNPLIKCEDPCLSGYLTDEFIDDFRKAMKGE